MSCKQHDGYALHTPLHFFARPHILPSAALPCPTRLPRRRDFVRDFLVGVVGRPAVLAGNSIGGFISASAAADYPELVAGLALVNT